MNPPTETDSRLFQPKSKRLAASAGAFGVLLAAIYVAGIGLPNQDGDPASEINDASAGVLTVNTLVAQLTPSYLQERSFNGIVRARRSSELSFSRPGQLNRVLVDQGDKVEAGDALAELDTRRLTDQRTKLQTASDGAKAELTKLIADARFRSMEAIRAEVQALKTQVRQLSVEINSDVGAAADRSATSGDTGPSARDRLNNIQPRLDALDAISHDPQVVAKQAAYAELVQQIAQLDTEIQQSTLRAPFDGVIAMRYVSDGILVAPSVRVMRIVERDALEVWVGLPADVADDVAKGQTHVINIGDRDVEAAVVAKHPELDLTTRTRTVVFSLDTAVSAATLPGEVARIKLERPVESLGFWLPITSLTRETRGLWSVYAVDRGDDGNQFVSRRYVEVIHFDGARARVRGTLDDGAVVIADGTHRVVPGQQVQIVGKSQTPKLDAERGAMEGIHAGDLGPST